MAQAVKFTLGFAPTLTGDKRYSWTESHWLPGTSNADLSTYDTKAVNLANARLGLCASNVQLLSVRLSLFNIDVNGRPLAARQRNRILVPGDTAVSGRVQQNKGLNAQGAIATNPLTSTPVYCDQPKSCVQCFLDGQIAGGGGLGTGTLFLAGVPDDIIQTGPGGTPDVNAVPGWNGAWIAFLNELKNDGFAFLGTTQPPSKGPIPILRWANEAASPFRLMFTIGANTFNVGDKVHIRRVRALVAKGQTGNGIWKIDATAGPDALGNFTYTLKNTGGLTASYASDGTAESVTQSFFTYLGTGTPQRATTRKRGATYGAARGKSRPRQRQLA